VLIILHEIESLGVHGAAVISVADIGIRLDKHDLIEVTAERLMVEYAPGAAQPLRKFLNDRVSAPRMLEKKLRICPRRRFFVGVENEIGFGRHLLTPIIRVSQCLGTGIE
jgi:hypothetical protein